MERSRHILDGQRINLIQINYLGIGNLKKITGKFHNGRFNGS